MRRVVYYVASSVDGFICGPNGDIRVFVEGGSGIDQYFTDLKTFDTVVMGRHTYEFGYRFGLKPGHPAYPNMRHYIFSNSLKFSDPHPLVHVRPTSLSEFDEIRKSEGSDIYLCGGGEFAGWLLDNERIDVLKIKLNPLVLGVGTRLFGKSTKKIKLDLHDHARYENGLQIISYSILY